MSTDSAAKSPQHWTRSRPALIAGGIALTLAALWTTWWVAYRFTHSISNDAFVETHLINVSPQAAGTVVQVFVQEQDRVTKGQLLAIVDPSTYERETDVQSARLALAEAALSKAKTDLALLIEQVPRRVRIADMKLSIARETQAEATSALDKTTHDVDDGVSAARHSVDGARAGYVMAEQDFGRYKNLFDDGSAPERKFQDATRAFHTARADLRVAEARLGQAEASRQDVSIARQRLAAAKHSVGESQTELELARLGDLQIEAMKKLVAERERAVTEARRSVELAQTTLGYTRITAPYDGVIAKKWRHLGDYAHVGDPIYSMYNPDLLYVTVYLEETLLEGVAPGNAATLQVEAFDRPFSGRVLWIGSATSANFSLIPRDISSGEFTYVVQRVPTRIAIDRDDRWPLLRPGLSVTATIAHGEGDPQWAREALQQEATISGVHSGNEARHP